MGIIQKQTVKASFYSYLGVAVGFVSVVFLRPHCLDTAQNGILELILAISALIVQVSSLGFQSAGLRFFPYFRDHNNKHNGFLFLSLLVAVIGFLGCRATLELLLHFDVFSGLAYQIIFDEYAPVLWGLSFFALLFSVFDNYNRVLYDVVTGTALKEFYQKLFTAGSIVLLLFFSIDFKSFSYIWLIANVLPALILIAVLIRNGHFFLKPDFSILTPSLVKGLCSVSIFAVLSGLTTMVIQYIDKLMIGSLLGLSETGIYGITVYFAAVIGMPARALYRISGTIVADKWKEGDTSGILKLYKESCLNQLLIGLLLFLGLWCNIDNVFHLLPTQYQAGKYVILFMSLATLFDMAAGINGVILSTSKYYHFDTYFFIALVFLVIGANYLLIPFYGLTGAAIASALSIFLFNLFRFLFVLIKMGMQPFSFKNVGILVVGLGTWGLVSLIPVLPYFILDMIVRLVVITAVYLGIIYRLKLSYEMNNWVDSILSRCK